VFITEYLPEKFKQQRKQLIPKFKEARAKKLVWKVLDENYTLFVDDKQIEALYLKIRVNTVI